MEEAVEAVAPLDWAAVWSGGWFGRSQPEPAIWTLVMVMLEEVDEYAAEVALVADHQPVEAFAAHRLHESLCVGVRDGSADQGADRTDPFGREDFAEDAGELAVAITDQEPTSVERAGEGKIAACWATHDPVGFRVMPARWTRRVSSSMKNARTRGAAGPCRRRRNRRLGSQPLASAGTRATSLVFDSLVGFMLCTRLLAGAPASLVSTYAYVTPLLGAAMGATVLDEPLWAGGCVGAALVLGAVALELRGR